MSQNNNQSDSVKRYKIKSPSRGGKRHGAGRPKGSSNKVSTEQLQNEMYKLLGKSYAKIVVEELQKSIVNNDTRLTQAYLAMLGNKMIADKKETDITTQGEKIGIQLQFIHQELEDWKK